jgi:L-methionine (R)-S-oxide reductase
MPSKAEFYQQLAVQLQRLLADEPDLITKMAQMSALLFHNLPDINWAGFYRYVNDELLLGPFQGKPACDSIPLGEGACGAAALHCQTVVVPNVHEYHGPISCDSASQAEIVLPVVTGIHLVGVLDIDSTTLNRFDAQDVQGLESLVQILVASLSSP